MNLFCDGIVLYWKKEININKKWKNTSIGKKIINHELKHLELIEKIKKEQNPLKKAYIIIINNLFDYFDSYRLGILKTLYGFGIEIEIKKKNESKQN
jgi:hypothetical protein